jgi:FAD/FMN-containing dehydrogenase
MWVSPSEDEFWLAAMKDSVARLKEVAIAEGIYDAEFAIYPNYASADTTPEELYGKNLPRLREIRQAVDPKRVMDLAGGFPL